MVSKIDLAIYTIPPLCLCGSIEFYNSLSISQNTNIVIYYKLNVYVSEIFSCIPFNITNLRMEYLYCIMSEPVLEIATIYASLATIVIAMFTIGIFIIHGIQTKHIKQDLKDRNNLKFYNIISNYVIEDKKLHLKQKNALEEASSEYVEPDTEDDFCYRLDQVIIRHLIDRLDELEEFSRTVRYVGIDLKMVKKIVHDRIDTLYGQNSHIICQSFLKHPENKERFENLHWLKKELSEMD